MSNRQMARSPEQMVGSPAGLAGRARSVAATGAGRPRAAGSPAAVVPAAVVPGLVGRSERELDVARESDVPISTQITGSSPIRSMPAACSLAGRLPPVRDLGAALRVNPNTIRAVYRRLVRCRLHHRPAWRRHARRRPAAQRPGAEALDGLVAELLRRGAAAGFSPDEVAAATFAAAVRAAPARTARAGAVRRVHDTDAAYDARRLNEALPELVEASPRSSTTSPIGFDAGTTTSSRRRRSTPTRRRPSSPAGRPSSRCIVGPGYVDLMHEIAALPPGARIGLVCASERGTDNIAETLRLSGARGVDIVAARRNRRRSCASSTGPRT